MDSKRQWALLLGAAAIALTCLAIAIQRSPTRPLVNCGMDDTARYLEPMSTYQREVIASGQLPLWNPYQACGLPLLAMMQASPLYPGNWPAMLWSTFGFKLGAVLHLTLSVVGMVLWLRALGIHPAGAATGAILFTSNVAILHWICTQPYHQVLALWPLLFWAAHRVLSHPTPRSAAVLGLVGAAVVLAGGMQFIVYGGYGVLLYVAFRLLSQVTTRRGDARRVLLYLALAGVCALALAAVQLLPGMEVAGLSQRSPGGLTASQILFYAPLGLTGAARALVTPARAGYLGTCLLLCLAGTLGRRNLGTRLAFATLGILSWLLTTGTGPLFEGFIRLPTGNWFRFPTRFATLTVFAAATLGALAVHDAAHGERFRVWRVLALTILLGAICSTMDPTRRWYGISLAVILIVASCMGSKPCFARASLAYLIPFVLLVETLATAPNPLTSFDALTANSGLRHDLIAYLQKVQGMSRVHFRHALDRSLPVKSGMRHRIYADLDYDPFIPRRMAEYWEYLTAGIPTGENFENGMASLTVDAAHLRLLDYLGTRYIVESPWEPFLKKGSRPPDQFRRIFRSKDGYAIVVNLGARPRAEVVARAELIAPGEPLLKRLADPSFPAGGTVLVEDAADVIDAPSSSAGKATISRYLPESVEIIVEATQPGMLILNDSYFPGWRATVDGQSAKITPVNYLFRGVKVSAGTHLVRFEYQPRSVYVGALISTFGLLLTTVLLLRRGRQPDHSTPL